MPRRRNTSGHQDGSPDLFSELVDPEESLRLETIKFIDLCLGTDVSDDDFRTAAAGLRLTDHQCSDITRVLKGSDYDLANLSSQTDDAELAFLLLRLILGCIF